MEFLFRSVDWMMWAGATQEAAHLSDAEHVALVLLSRDQRGP